MSAIPATDIYRTLVAATAAAGGPLPAAAEMAFGVGTAPPSPGDTGLAEELLRKPLAGIDPDGVVLRVTGTLLGSEAGAAAITEIGVFAADGTLMGRRTFAPKQLEPETRIDVELDFQF